MTRLAAALATLLLLVGCASEAPPSASPDATDTQSTEGDAGDRGKEGRGKKTSKGDEPSEKHSAGSGSSEEGSTSEDRAEEDSAPGDGDGSRDSAYPASGTYTFSQSGYEEFCDNTGNCDKDQLPNRQPTTISYEQSDSDSAVVVALQKQSNSRKTKTWTRFDSNGAHITKVYVEFEYSGFRFDRTYEPQPPVEALRFPLSQGESWSGEWKSSTSGSYSIKVGGRTQIEVGGRTVTAYRIETTTEFRGDFEGKSRIVAYVDPDTKAIVATDGVLNVTSNFGRYSTVFETRLLSGPRY